jgi:hypothetical protein
MSIQTVEIALPTGIDSVSVGLAEPISIVEVRQGPAGADGPAVINAATQSDGTADLDLSTVTLSGTGGSPFTSTLTGGVNFANRTFTLPDASGTLTTVESLANSATITASTAVEVNTIVLRDGAGQINITNSNVAGTTAYASTAGWTYAGSAASAHRTALGLGATGSIAASAPLTLTQTWTNAAVTYTGLQVNVTDTASNAASLLMDLRVGGVSQFRVDKTGNLYFGAYSILANTGWSGALRINGGSLNVGNTGNGVFLPATSFIRFNNQHSITDDGAANTLAQRNGNAAQESRIYGTYTGPGNYRRLALKMSTTGVAQIVAEGGGAGASDNRLEFVTGGATRMTVAADGNITASGSITGTGSLTLAAGGANQNVTITPNGTGKIVASKKIDLNSITHTGSDAVLLVGSGTVESLPSGLCFFNNATAPFFNLAGSDATSTIFGGGVSANSHRSIRILASGQIMLGSGSSAADAGMVRTSSGLIEINNGTAGTFRDLKLRNLTASGDIEVTDSTKGIILKSPDGTRYRVTVSDLGVLSAASL